MGNSQGHLLHLLRHGSPETPGLLLGWTDMPSTDAGIAHCLAQARDLQFQAVISSDLTRATAAASAIAAMRATPLQQDARWRELDFGHWDGLSPAAVDAVQLQRFQQDPDEFPPPKGERWSALIARVTAAIAALPATDVLVLCHGGSMRAALQILCGLESPAPWALDLPYGALLSLRRWLAPDSGPGTAQIIGLRP